MVEFVFLFDVSQHFKEVWMQFLMLYFLFYFLHFLLLFKYSCLYFPTTTSPLTHPNLPPAILPPFGFVHGSFIFFRTVFVVRNITHYSLMAKVHYPWKCFPSEAFVSMNVYEFSCWYPQKGFVKRTQKAQTSTNGPEQDNEGRFRSLWTLKCAGFQWSGCVPIPLLERNYVNTSILIL